MKDFTSEYPGRSFEIMFYANDDDNRVEQVQAFGYPGPDGFIPPPNHGRVWLPDYGQCSVGVHVFATAEEAKAKVTERLQWQRQNYVDKIAWIDRCLQQGVQGGGE